MSSMEEGDDCECDLLELKDKEQSKDEQSKDEQSKDEQSKDQLDILLEHARIQVGYGLFCCSDLLIIPEQFSLTLLGSKYFQNYLDQGGGREEVQSSPNN